MWRTHLSFNAQRAHYLWDVTGRDGQGRLELAQANLEVASLEGGYLHRARLLDCNLTSAHLSGSGLEDAWLERCDLTGARLNMGDLDRATLRDCTLRDANLDLAHLDAAVVDGGCWRDVSLVRATLDRAHITGVDLEGARLTDARLHQSVITACNLRGVDFSRSQPLPKGAIRALAHDVRVERCDLTGANVEGLKLGGAVFVDCVLSRLQGRPVLDGVVTFQPWDEQARQLAQLWGIPNP